MSKLILASKSPRRKELLEMMGVIFDVVPSNINEPLDSEKAPEEVAMNLALKKAKQVAEEYPENIVIGSDTLMFFDGNQIEKPKDKQEAKIMLKNFCGRSHEVYTAVALVQKIKGYEDVNYSKSRVYFKLYDKKIIDNYVESGEPMDKAGGYGVQGGGAQLIDKIAGDYETIVGLPTTLLAEMLVSIGVKAKPAHAKPTVQTVKMA